MYRNTSEFKKEAIITEYLTGSLSLRQMGRKYGMNHKTIHHWIMKKHKPKEAEKKEKRPDLEDRPLPTDVEELQKELRKARLQNKLLNAIIDIAEQELKVDIRKKPGTKQ
jgi:transposase-like protein